MAEKAQVPAIRFNGFTEAWEQRKLQDLGIVRTGYPFDSTQFKRDGEYLVITNGNIQDNSPIVNNSLGNRVTINNPNIAREYLLDIDDILVTMDGTVGRTAKVVEKKQILAQRVGRISSHEEPEFIYQWLNTGRFSNAMSDLSHGGTIKHISLNEIRSFQSMIPKKLGEKKKISIYFKKIDNLITLHQRKLSKLQNVKKAMLEKMFPKNGSDVPEIRFSGFTEAWEQRKLSEIADIVGGGTPSTSNPEYWGGKIDWYAPAEMEGQRYAIESAKKITKLGLQKSSATILPADKTVLFTSRAGIGKMAILKRPAATNQGFQSLVLKDGYSSYFIYSMGSKIKELAEGVASGSTFLEISGKMLGNIVIDVPPLAEQKRIGKYFQELDNLITLHQRKLEKLQNLKKACLEKMFV